MSIGVSNSFSKAWGVFKEDWKRFVGAGVLWGVAYIFVFMVLLSLVRPSDFGVPNVYLTGFMSGGGFLPLLSFFVSQFYVVLLAVLMGGFMGFCYSMMKRAKPSIPSVLFPKQWKSFFGYGLVLFVGSSLIEIFSFFVGWFAVVFYVVYAGVMFFFAFAMESIIVDGVGVFGALRNSLRFVSKRIVSVLGVYVAMLVLMLAAVIPFAILAALPVMTLGRLIFYSENPDKS